MFKLSESRGKEASGLAIRFKESIYVLKEPIASSRLVKTAEYNKLFNYTLKTKAYDGKQLQAPLLILGHSRIQTNGLSEINTNNQPVVKDGAVGIHNGIIVNDDELWKSFSTLTRKYDVDTEAFLSLLQMFRAQGKPLIEALRLVFERIEGSASMVVQFDNINNIALATNTGSLYISLNRNEKILVFASEKYILQQILNNKLLKDLFAGKSITQIKSGQGYVVDVNLLKIQMFYLKEQSVDCTPDELLNSKVSVFEVYDQHMQRLPDPGRYFLREDITRTMTKNWEALYSGENLLRRCTRCILPETMPFITFDEEGVCNFAETTSRGAVILEEKKHLKSLFRSTVAFQTSRMSLSVSAVEETARSD